MTRFEYTVLEIPTKGFLGYKIDFESLNTQLNDMGRKGWEVITLSNSNLHQGSSKGMLIILKRELTH